MFEQLHIEPALLAIFGMNLLCLSNLSGLRIKIRYTKTNSIAESLPLPLMAVLFTSNVLPFYKESGFHDFSYCTLNHLHKFTTLKRTEIIKFFELSVKEYLVLHIQEPLNCSNANAERIQVLTEQTAFFLFHNISDRPSSMYLYLCIERLTASLSTSWWKVQFDVYGVKSWVEMMIFLFLNLLPFHCEQDKNWVMWIRFVNVLCLLRQCRWDLDWLRIWAETNISATGHCVVIEFNVMCNAHFSWIPRPLFVPLLQFSCTF